MPTDHTPVSWHNLAQDQKDRLLKICQSLSRTILDTEGLEETLDLLAEKMLKTGLLTDLGMALVYPHER
jgi:hypothetical protein